MPIERQLAVCESLQSRGTKRIVLGRIRGRRAREQVVAVDLSWRTAAKLSRAYDPSDPCNLTSLL
jgi:hypothetical protein